MPLVGRADRLARPRPLPARCRLEHEHHPLIAPRGGAARGRRWRWPRSATRRVAAFVVLHLDDRGVGHGATVFGAFAAMVVLTRLVGGDLPDRVGPAPGGDRGGAGRGGRAWRRSASPSSLPVAIAGALAMGAAFSLLYPSLSLIVVEPGLREPAAARRSAPSPPSSTPASASARRWPALAAALTDYEGAFLLAAAIALAAAPIAFAIAGRGRALLGRGAPAELALGDEQRLQARGRSGPRRR